MVNPISFPQYGINSTVDPSMWSSLANLGNVYREAQAQRMKQQALSSLGTDPEANIRTLLQSGDPQLAQTGLTLQQKAKEDARANAYLAIQQEAAKRAQEEYEKKQEEEDAAAKSIGGLIPAAPPARPPAATPDVFTRGAPPIPASPGQVTPAPPLTPGEADLTGTVSAPPPVAPVVDRIASNLVSGQPAAAAGVTREQLGELFRNPLTRPVATTFLQNMISPGTWKVEKTDDGRLIAVNEKTLESRDVTPPTATGAPPASKEQRERDLRYADAIARGYDKNAANRYALTGKLEGEELRPSEQKRVDTLTDEARVGQRVLSNVAELRQLSKTGWGFTGAGPASLLASTILPDALARKTGAVDTQDLINAAHTNVVNVAKATFPQRVTNVDIKLLEELESSANQPDVVRQRLYDRTEKMIKEKVDEALAEAEAIRNKTYYKPGGGARPPGVATSSGTASTPPLTWKIVPSR